MDNLGFQPVPPTPAYTKKSSKFPRIFLALALLIILAGAGYFTYLHFQGNAPKKVQPTPTPAPTQAPTATPSASASGTLTPQPSTTGTQLKRSAITVNVLNGSGVTGAAGQTMTYLTGLGYTEGTAGNADTTDYTGVTIKIKKSKANYLPQLKADLAKKYTVSSTDTTLPETSTADAEVIVGK